MSACIAFNLAPLWMTLGALVGLPIGYGLGWMIDPHNLPRMLVRVFLDVHEAERAIVALTTYSMGLRGARP